MKPRALIIEDNLDSQRLLHIHLHRLGFQTLFAQDGVGALSLARQHLPDLIVLDLGLPAGHGYTVMERIRNFPQLAHVPIIVVSARRKIDHEEASLRAGAVAYLEKPIDLAAFEATIAEAMGLSELDSGEEPDD